MGSSPLMALGVKAMQANFAALQATGHNIANANVAGYSRQGVELATAQGQFTGAGFFGKGVVVQGVVRSHSEFLTREAASAAALASMDEARLTHLKRIETLFQPGETGLGYAATDFINAMVDLTSRPGDAATRAVVLARADDLAARFTAAGNQLDAVQSGIDADLRSAVAEVNSLARSIAAANQKIASLKGLGQPANDLLDERDRLLAQLSEKVQVTRIDADDGTLGVFIGGGQRLVLGAQADELVLSADARDPMRASISLTEGRTLRELDPASLGGGAIAGLLRAQNEDLVDARNLIGRFAAALGGAVNAQQMRGITLNAPLGTVAGEAMFAVGAPLALANANNARDALGVPIGSVALTVTDPAALEASDYALKADPANPGFFLLERLADGLVRSVASGDVVDGVRIDVNGFQPGDRFLLQPVGRAANGFAALLGDPRDVAAASPLIGQVANGNTGTASVATLRVTAAPLPVPGASARITFTDDAGNYTWDLVDAGGGVLASGGGTWQPGQTIPPAGSDINGFALTLAGVPRSGDVVTVEPTPPGAMASNNGNAVALLALRDARLAGRMTVDEAWGQAMADVAVRVQSTASASDISLAVAQQTESARSAVAGVNLDEEAARLIQFQQSYQAAAKVLQIAQSLFDTLLQVTNR
jgi:flagellar hook-associated protein 1 FlgK